MYRVTKQLGQNSLLTLIWGCVCVKVFKLKRNFHINSMLTRGFVQAAWSPCIHCIDEQAAVVLINQQI